MKKLQLKKKVTALALAALMLAGTAVPASAASTATFTFTHSGNTYGLTTQATNFPSYVTAWAKVTNKSNGTYKYDSNRGYKAASATARKAISNAKNVVRTGAAFSS